MKPDNSLIDLPAMVAGYVECLLWSSTDDNGEPLDDTYFPTDLSEGTQRKAREDCQSFVAQCTDAGIDLTELPLNSASIGRDLWLTRNSHGAGFWDRGLGDVGDRLSDIAHAMGSVDPYVTDDGRVHTS